MMVEGSAPPAGGAAGKAWWAGLVLILVLGSTTAWTSRNYRFDDGLITARYAKNLGEGFGWTYNPGEVHNGSTSPLFTGLVALTGRMFEDYSMAAHWIAAMSLTANALAAAWLLATAGYAPGGILAGLILVTNPLMVMTFGLETQLFLALGTASVLAFDRRRPLLAFSLASATALTRGEGIFLLILLYGCEVWRQRRIPLVPIGLSALIALPWFLYSTVTFGTPLPDTFSAKVAQGASGLWGEGRWLFLSSARPILRQFGSQGVFNLLPFTFAPLGLWRAPVGVLLLTGVAILEAVFYSIFNIPGYHWYYASAVGAAILLSGVAIVHIARPLPRLLRVIPYALVLGFALVQFNHSRTIQQGEDPNYIALGEWLRANAAPTDEIAAFEIGSIGWHSGLRVIDPLGLVTPGAAEHLRRRDTSWWVAVRRPRFIALHQPPWTGMESPVAADDLFRLEYVPVITLGSEGPRQLVLYARRGLARKS